MLAPQSTAQTAVNNVVTDDLSADIAWQRFSVAYEYPVCFTQQLFDVNNLTLVNVLQSREAGKRHKMAVFIDEGVVNACPHLLTDIQAYALCHELQMDLIADPMIMASGERIKSEPEHLQSMQAFVAEQRIDRHSFILGIGGGALLDAVGLVAATAHRGIRHIRIPTTVLAQNDSGVGVKNGVNFFGQKNYMGTFAPPFAVLNDYNFIAALPSRDKRAGMAEAVKVALIRDRAFFNWLEKNATKLAQFDKASMLYMIRRCAELHMHQIAKGGDPFENGSARPLDFGHWSAHRLESMTEYALRHGEAVAIGVALDCRYSVLADHLTHGEEDRVCRLLESLGFTLWHEALNTRTGSQLAVMQGLTDFKEHLGGELTITLLEAIGQSIDVHEMDEQHVLSAIQWLEARQGDVKNATVTDIFVAKKLRTESIAEQLLRNRNRTFEEQLDVVCGRVDEKTQLNTSAASIHLQQWLGNSLNPQNYVWLTERLQLIQETEPDRNLHITLGLIPRRLGRSDLTLSADDIRAAQVECGVHWDPSGWSVDAAARCLTLLTLLHTHPDTFDQCFTELCNSADLNEAITFYRCTAVLPQTDQLDTLIGAGLRTHIRAIFEAIAHNNPYPSLHFNTHRWNHMVLKALFIDSQLWPIQGLDDLANPELAAVLCDYAHERWAAHRQVTPELWRCVGPFATGNMLDDLHRALSSERVLEQQAGLLALMESPDANHDQLRKIHPVWCSEISNGSINWNSIGSKCTQL